MKMFWSSLFVMMTLISFGQNPEKFGMVDNDLPQGLKVGAVAPKIELKSNTGKVFSMEEALVKDPLVVMFYRGSWCPHCSRYMSRLSDSLSYILQTGATVVAISPERFDEENGKIESTEGIILLHDANGKVMVDYDVDFVVTEAYQKKLSQFKNLDLAENNEQDLATLPVPATFVVNQEGVITYRYFDLNYKNRAPISQIIEALIELE